MNDLIPHQLKLSEAQMKKLLSGLTAKIPHSSLGADKGDVIIHLAKDNADKLLHAYRGGGLASLKMSKPEIQATATHGSGFDLEKILSSPVGQKIASKLVDKAIDKLVGGAVSFEKIMKSPVVQKIGDKVIDKAIDRALGGKVKKGSEEAKERMRKLREMRGMKGGKASAYNTLVDIQKGLRAVGQPFERTIGVNPADIGEPIGEALGAELYKAVYGHPRGYGISREIYNAVNGKGVGKGVKQSKAYKTAMKSSQGFVPDVPAVKNAPASSFGVDKRVKPAGDQMTLSPYQLPSAPAMNPFVPKHYTQEGGTQSGYGGRGLYAGKGLF